MNKYNFIKKQDKEIYRSFLGEEKRQAEGLELIPSENYVSYAVREANGSCFTNKYSEGYPGKRYYGGQDFTDEIENLSIKRACKLFGAKYANVQPHSGAPANIIVYSALLNPGDKILGMDLSHGGHLTHGHPVTESAKVYKFVRYKMKNISTGEIDYEELEKIAKKEKPKIILAGFSSYPRNLDWKKFKKIADSVGAITMADVAHIAGLIAGGVLENPFKYGFDILTSTTHKTLRGPRGGLILVRENKDFINKINKTTFPGLQGGPHMHSIAAKAVCFKEASSPSFSKYCKNILKNTKAMEKVFKEKKVEMITGGSDNHLLLLDVYKTFNISGNDAQNILDKIGITLNKNVIPDDTKKPLDPSGIRLGTPAITTRGLKEKDCKKVAEIIVEALEKIDDKKNILKLKKEVLKISKKFPIPKSF